MYFQIHSEIQYGPLAIQKKPLKQFLTGTLPAMVTLVQASQGPSYPSHLVGSKHFPRTKNNLARSLPETLSNLKTLNSKRRDYKFLKDIFAIMF